MNTIGIFLYIVSVVAWWAGFNYAATRTESPTRRKLLSTAAAFALAWPAAFMALAGALATKAAANLMIAVGNGINNTWDAAVNDEGDTTIVTKLTPMGTAMRVRHENSDTNTETVTETHPALADDTLLMPPPPPPAANKADGDTTSQDDVDDNAATETLNNDADMDDETVTIQKVTLADII